MAAWPFWPLARRERLEVVACSLVEAAKLNDIDPQAWFAGVLIRVPDHKITKVDELVPWS